MDDDTPRPDVGERLGSGAAAVLAAFVESVADAIYAVDGDGRVQYVNPAGLRVLGYEHESELLGRPSHATIHHRHPDGTPFAEADCPLLRPRATGAVVRVEEDWFVRRDGTMVPVAYSSAPVDTEQGRGAVVVFRDTTERRAALDALAREERERARAQALHASRARIVQATLDERRRMGRDLHDGAQQRLVNVVLALGLAARRVAGDAEAAALLGGALEEARAAIADLRELAAGLHPSVLTDLGLRGALESLTARAPLPVALDVTPRRLPAVLEATAYFVAAEALANATKHAEAREASVRVAVEADDLVVAVADDGRGGAAPARDGGSGLAGLADRVAALDGTLEVVSPPGAGTRLVARLPLGAPVSPPAAG
ncbi:PAS domain S-box protein [Baekduia soli]|uniref:histidine kinase n=1 Tax=Baekduia soli TaxID=496014 RepID=A0A5B8U9K7_9ACTN|nr:PAS domain S-box protein [Baekduia soli]QEC49754.1 PAS domain S-box protein [Baekduia soli]